MKVEANKVEEEFKPCSINTTFESDEELEQFFSVFNYGGLTKLTPAIDHKGIRDAIEAAHGNIPCYYDAWERIKFGLR